MRGSPKPQGLHMDLLTPELPPIAALFVIQFDLKAGYTITWHRTTPSVTLDGVEFKSLPSGLHNLDSDLVYFVHTPHHAGISAFVRAPAPSSDRNALQLSIGALVPLTYGRLGRSWRHAANLQGLARTFAADPRSHAVLDEYFAAHAIPAADSSNSNNAAGGESARHRGGARRKGSESGLAKELEPFHPARSLRAFIGLLGPLVWPVWRAALEGKRILVVTGAPVEKACNFVYDISILSTVPLSAHPLLPRAPARLRPLFCIGISDIPLLEAEAKAPRGGGWVACTTDEILHMKTALYDLVVTLPAPGAADAWPRLETSAGAPVLATQRDLVRYRGLKRWIGGSGSGGGGEEGGGEGGGRRREESVCEPMSWREIAYSGFLWWASAGEKRSEGEGEGDGEGDDDDDDDDDEGRPLLDAEPEEHEDGEGAGGGAPRSEAECLEAEVVAYFQGMTDALLAGIAEVVEEAEEGEVVVFGCEEVERLGLDKGLADAAFVKAVCERYFGREARVEVEGWSCLGGLC